MAEEFQGGVCGSTWWNQPMNLFASPCLVAQLGGGYDMGSCGWPNELIKGKSNNNQVFCDNSLAFPVDHMESTFDTLGFGLSPTSSTTDWNQPNLLCKGGSNEENYDSLLHDNLSTRLCNGVDVNSPTMMNSCNYNQDGSSPPMTMTASSNSSGDSSTITCEGFAMSSSASYLIQALFDDVDEPQQQQQQQHMSQLINPNISNNYGSMPPCSWVESSMKNIPHVQPTQSLQLLQQNDKFNGGVNMLVNGGQASNDQYNTAAALSNIRTSLLNSLQSRSRAPSLHQKSPTCLATKVSNDDVRKESKNNMNNNEQPPAKRARIETPSSLPTFKVRKEKLGDRITALQQLVSPFGKTDTASVLHEAIEYIKFLHDQVHVLSTPYLKNGAPVQHQQQGSEKMKDNEESKLDLHTRGLCLVPIASTYPVAQETPVDFWTPTFGGTPFR